MRHWKKEEFALLCVNVIPEGTVEVGRLFMEKMMCLLVFLGQAEEFCRTKVWP